MDNAFLNLDFWIAGSNRLGEAVQVVYPDHEDILDPLDSFSPCKGTFFKASYRTKYLKAFIILFRQRDLFSF